jgi:hypothetical protein
MADSGVIGNDAVVAGITTSYALGKAILLHEDSAIEPNSVHGAIPNSSAIWSHLVLKMTVTAGAVSSVECFLTWDAAGDEIAAGPTQSAFNVVSGMTTSALRSVVIPMDGIMPRASSVQTTPGKLYLFVKTDSGGAGTVTLNRAELHWYVPDVQR